MAQSQPNRAIPDLAAILPAEVFSGALLGALMGSLTAVLGALDMGAFRLALVGAGVFGALGFACWVSRLSARQSFR